MSTLLDAIRRVTACLSATDIGHVEQVVGQNMPARHHRIPIARFDPADSLTSA